MKEKTRDLFRYERRILNKANRTIENPKYQENPLLKKFKSLTSKYKRLLRQSEKILKISDSNQKILRETQNNLESLLNNADQGFLTFGSDFIIDDEYSLECEKILGKDIAGENSLELIFEDRNLQEEIFLEIFSFDKEEASIYIDLLPKNLEINDKFIKLKYKLIDNEQRKIMCILTDISKEVELENKLEKEKNNLKMIINAVINQNTVRKYIEDYKDYFSNRVYQKLAKEDNFKVISDLYKEVHTFKGIFGQWNMSKAAKKLHQVEDKLDKLKDRREIKIEDLLEFIVDFDFNGFLRGDIEVIEDTLGQGFLEDGGIVLLKKKNILELETKAKKYLSKKEYKVIENELKRLRTTAFKELFEVHKDYLIDLAKREGKEIESFNIAGDDDLFVDESAYYDFNKSLIHIFRNIISHGIEFPEEREIKAKTAGGNIVSKIEKVEDKLKIVIKDDGAGIDIDKLKEKAVEKGIYSQDSIDSISRKEAIQLIFSNNLSTKDSVEELTGRGVGMAAVKDEVSKLGGEISVKTELDKGTEFEIVLPFIED